MSEFQPNIDRRRTLLALASMGAAGMVAPLVNGQSPNRRLTPPSRPVDLGYFGMHVMRLAVRQPWYSYGNLLTAWPSVPFGVLRPAYANWHNLQPKPGRWDFSALDQYVSMAGQHGAEVMLPLCSPPQWASARPDEKSPWGQAAPGGAAEPSSLSDWSRYVQTVAERYKGRIRRYEFWNEPNAIGHTPFFTGTVETAVALTVEARRVLKSVDPANTLAGPAGTGRGKELNWVDVYLAGGAKDHLDALSYHFYVAHGAPEAMIDYVSRFRALMSKHGLGDLPLVNSESGWVIANEKSPSSHLGADDNWPVLSQDMAAAYVSRALILGWALGLAGYHLFCWDHFSMGLVEPTTKEIKPAGVAYGKTVEWLLGATMTSCELDHGVWTCALRQTDGSKARIVWRDHDGQSPWAIPGTWGAASAQFLDGIRQTLTPGPTQIALGPQPVLLS